MNKIASISLSADEVGFLCNAVGESRELAAGDELEFKLLTGEGYQRADEIRDFLERILRDAEGSQALPIGQKKLQLFLSFKDLKFLRNATRTTLDGVEDWELHTRTGETPEEARKLLAYLETTLSSP